MQSTTSAPPTLRDLATMGFSPTEIERLAALKGGYDAYRECCASHAEYERLNFLKWRYAHGRIRRG